jgi:hypothetical protein
MMYQRALHNILLLRTVTSDSGVQNEPNPITEHLPRLRPGSERP